VPNVEKNKAPPTSQIAPPLLYAPALEECIDILFGAMFALLICHSVHLVQVRPHPTMVAVLGNWSSTEKTQGKLGERSVSAKARA
jgi:hypothetical protein